MKDYKIIITFFFTLLVVQTISCQNSQPNQNTSRCEKCDIQVIVETEKSLLELSDDQIKCFLEGFSESCSNNVEYSEYSNEVLFKVISKYPDKFLSALSNLKIEREYIYSELSNSILDFDLLDIRKRIEETKSNSEYKSKVLLFLNEGIGKQN